MGELCPVGTLQDRLYKRVAGGSKTIQNLLQTGVGAFPLQLSLPPFCFLKILAQDATFLQLSRFSHF
jgi:hypothetical protein